MTTRLTRQFLLYSTPLPDAHWLDTVVLALYLVAAVSCMFSSAMWHVLSGCASKKWFEWGACVDCGFSPISIFSAAHTVRCDV